MNKKFMPVMKIPAYKTFGIVECQVIIGMMEFSLTHGICDDLESS